MEQIHDSGYTEILPAERTKNVKYAVRDIVVLAEDIKKTLPEGQDLLWLNIGDPLKPGFGFETPSHMIESVYKAMKDQKNGYAPSKGLEEARQAIWKQGEKQGISSILDVLTFNGGSEAIEVALTALLNSERATKNNDGQIEVLQPDELLVPSPGYPLYGALLSKLEAVGTEYFLDESNNWQPDISDIESKIKPGITKGIVIINPNNPTGSVYSKEVLHQIVEVAKKNNLVILSDEIYDKLVFDENVEYHSIASLDDEVCVITLNGLSKSYLVPGWRIGWAIISGDEVKCKKFLEAMNKQTRARLCANNPMQFAIKPALEGAQEHISEMLQKIKKRRDIVMEILNGVQGISCVAPQGAFYAFPRLEIGETDDLTWVKGLIEHKHVVTVHGDGFGQKPGTKHFRITLLPDEKTLTEACQGIKDYMDKKLYL